MTKYKKVYNTTEIKEQMEFYRHMMFAAKQYIDWKHWAVAYVSACNEMERRVNSKKVIEDAI